MYKEHKFARLNMKTSLIRTRTQTSFFLSCHCIWLKVSVTTATLFALDLTVVGAAGTPTHCTNTPGRGHGTKSSFY